MALADFFDNLGTNIGNAPADAWFSLAESLANRKGLAGGLSAFGRVSAQDRKRKGMYEALQGAMGGFNPSQQAFLKSLGPDAMETVAPIVMQKLFKPSATWQYKDADNDGRPDYQINSDTGQVDAYPMTIDQRMTSAVGAVNIPGLGTFDRFGNPINQPQGSPTSAPPGAAPMPTPASAPAAEPPAMRPTMAEPMQPAPNLTPAVAAEPTPGAKDPLQTMTVPVPAAHYGAFGLPPPTQGSQWVRDFNMLDKTWSQPRKAEIAGAIDTSKAIPAEVAGRAALAGEFLKTADKLRARIAAHEASGPINSAKLAFNMGAPGEIWRLASDGADAMQRMMTGAGMPASEAGNYAARFLPQFTDSTETKLSKHDNLVTKLKGIYDLVLQGRDTPDNIRKVMDAATAGPPPKSEASDDHAKVDAILGLK